MCLLAEKPKKKPRHTKLVLPSDKPQKQTYRATDRLGRSLAPKTDEAPGAQTPPPEAPAEAAEKAPASPGAAAGGAAKPPPPAQETPTLPENAVLMPRKNPRVVAVRRRKRRRRLLSLLAVLLVAVGIWLYFSGLYLYGVMAFQNFADSMRIRLTPGGGWPAPYTITGYLASREMGGGGFASVGDKDLALFSSSGTELRRVQHGYASPGLSAGDTRVCVYNRGGTEYAVEGRGGTKLRRKTQQEILFATMSPGGTLAVVTSSRYRAAIEIYGPLYAAQPDFSWTLVDEKPVVGAFYSDNKQFALACLSAQQGALGTTVYLLRTDKDQPLAQIRADDARVLQMEYLGQNRLLVVYDSYAATYNQKGEEISRYAYNGRSLQAAHQGKGGLALVFGSGARDSFGLVLLDEKMQPQFETEVAGTGTPRVLSDMEGVYLLFGQELVSFNRQGTPGGSETFTVKPLDLVQAGEPLVLSLSSAQPISHLLTPGDNTSTPPPASGAAASVPSSAAASPAPASSTAQASPPSSKAPSSAVPPAA